MLIKLAKKLSLFRNSRGGAAVESAIVLPVFIFTVLGILELGRVYFVKANMQNAIAAAARYRMLNTTATDQQVIDKVNANLSGMNPASVNVTVTGTATSKKIKITQNYIFLLNYSLVLSNEIDVPI